MILGTSGRGYFGYYYGPWAGRRSARSLFGAIGGLLHALATVIFGVDHIVSGVAINIIALGVAAFLAEACFTGLPGRRPDPVAAARPTCPRRPCPASPTAANDRRGQALVPGLRRRRRSSAALTTQTCRR